MPRFEANVRRVADDRLDHSRHVNRTNGREDQWCGPARCSLEEVCGHDSRVRGRSLGVSQRKAEGGETRCVIRNLNSVGLVESLLVGRAELSLTLVRQRHKRPGAACRIHDNVAWLPHRVGGHQLCQRLGRVVHAHEMPMSIVE